MSSKVAKAMILFLVICLVSLILPEIAGFIHDQLFGKDEKEEGEANNQRVRQPKWKQMSVYSRGLFCKSVDTPRRADGFHGL